LAQVRAGHRRARFHCHPSFENHMNYMEQYPVRIGVRLDEETRDKLQERISGLGISASAYIRMLLNETLNQKR